MATVLPSVVTKAPVPYHSGVGPYSTLLVGCGTIARVRLDEPLLEYAAGPSRSQPW